MFWVPIIRTVGGCFGFSEVLDVWGEFLCFVGVVGTYHGRFSLRSILLDAPHIQRSRMMHLSLILRCQVDEVGSLGWHHNPVDHRASKLRVSKPTLHYSDQDSQHIVVKHCSCW